MDFRTDKLLHGGDYNPEQWLKRPDILAKDIDMLEESGCNVVSLGIFSWSTLEPEEGVFHFEWLQEIIDKLYKRGISTILATPSGARPKWMADKYPEVLRVDETRHRALFGFRHNHCYTSPVYREKVHIINKKLAQEDAHSRKVIRMHQWMRYAAIIVLALMIGTGGGYLYYQADPTRNMITASSTDGKVKEVMLPDGTKVWLNQSATLRYPKEFSESERDVYLDGEAYFEVTKNRRCPFVVESEAMRIKVLGTTFNFKCDKSHKLAEATLIEGEIEVRGNHDEGMIILSPGQKAELNKTTRRLVVKQVDAKLDAVWHNDLIPFEQADIFVITRTLERFYDVKIILSPDIKSDKTYSGVLKKKDNIESVLQSLDNSIPINYKIVGDNIFISSRNK